MLSVDMRGFRGSHGPLPREFLRLHLEILEVHSTSVSSLAKREQRGQDSLTDLPVVQQSKHLVHVRSCNDLLGNMEKEVPTSV